MDSITILEILGAIFGISTAINSYPSNMVGSISAAGFAVVCIVLASKTMKKS